VIELAVDELARRLTESAEEARWAEAAVDASFMGEAAELAAAYRAADRQTWPRE
jgi:hypothetical protein